MRGCRAFARRGSRLPALLAGFFFYLTPFRQRDGSQHLFPSASGAPPVQQPQRLFVRGNPEFLNCIQVA